MQASRSLKQVIASLNDTFTSIDIRAVGAKKKVATQWGCIFLKVRLTSNNRSKLLEVYEKKKKDLDAKINVRFRLFAECRDIHELDSTINEIQNGLITLEGFPLKLLQSITDLYNQPIDTNYHDYIFSASDEKHDYKHWFTVIAYATSDNTTLKILQNFELTNDDMGIEYNSISGWLSIPEGKWQLNITYLIFIVPIYIKRDSILENENKLFVKYEISNSLVSKCKLRKIVHRREQEPKRYDRIPVSSLLSKEDQQQGEIAILKTTIDYEDI